MVDLSVKLGRLRLYNPVMVASGTFGCAEEFTSLIDINKLGAIVTKTVTLNPHRGNPMPRTIETACGLLNSIGLENTGIEHFLKYKIPFLVKLKTAVIVSIAGESMDEFRRLVNILNEQGRVDAIELNISCPNIKRREELIAQNPRLAYKVINSVRKNTKKTLIAKLSPNVTDIAEIARAAEDAGCDALSLINTIYGMSIDPERRRVNLANIFGGLSGPAIKPIALYMVYKVAQRVKVPVIGMGGIMTTEDALEFILAGATAVAVGTGNFINPRCSIEIIRGIKQYLRRHKINNIKKIIGDLKV